MSSVSTGTADPRAGWAQFREWWLRYLTDPLGLFAFDPAARRHILLDGVETYPFDPKWIVPARFEPARQAGTLDLQIVGTSRTAAVPNYGTVTFTLSGTRYEFVVFSAPGNEYHLSFRDDTSGLTTYPGGRVVFIPLPDGGHHRQPFDFVLDLNRVVNGPCGFTHNASCTLPPAGNRINLSLTAGERTATWMT